MINKRNFSAIVLATFFATSNIATADNALGNNFTANGGYAGMGATSTANNATLNFNGDSHVRWNSLNVGSGQQLNFNADGDARGLTVLNTVERGMSKIYGKITANDGIAHLIISNPNGLLFDGAQFNTTGI